MTHLDDLKLASERGLSHTISSTWLWLVSSDDVRCLPLGDVNGEGVSDCVDGGDWLPAGRKSCVIGGETVAQCFRKHFRWNPADELRLIGIFMKSTWVHYLRNIFIFFSHRILNIVQFVHQSVVFGRVGTTTSSMTLDTQWMEVICWWYV